jgi:hypothetical protein
MRTALITLTIGGTYYWRWKTLCEASWRAYANRHNYDVIVIQNHLDTSERATARSPAWQKCLVLRPDIAKDFERIIWVDADIIINPAAPAITQGIPIEQVGAMDEHTFPSVISRRKILNSLIQYWSRINPEIADNWRSFQNPADWHALAGLPRRGTHIVQTGVLVLSPLHHRTLLEHVYYSYEDIGGEPMNYEMRPLSFELQEHAALYWIDSRFNSLLSFLILNETIICGRSLDTIAEQARFVRCVYQNNHFVHFAGRHELMERLAGQTTWRDVRRNDLCPCGSGRRFKHCHGSFA